MHMVAARLGFEKTMVGTRWATPRPDCMDRLRKHYSHLAEGWFLARKAAWSPSGCMATNRAIARDVTTTPLRHFGAQPDFAVYGRDGELCCC